MYFDMLFGVNVRKTRDFIKGVMNDRDEEQNY